MSHRAVVYKPGLNSKYFVWCTKFKITTLSNDLRNINNVGSDSPSHWLFLSRHIGQDGGKSFRLPALLAFVLNIEKYGIWSSLYNSFLPDLCLMVWRDLSNKAIVIDGGKRDTIITSLFNRWMKPMIVNQPVACKFVRFQQPLYEYEWWDYKSNMLNVSWLWSMGTNIFIIIVKQVLLLRWIRLLLYDLSGV